MSDENKGLSAARAAIQAKKDAGEKRETLNPIEKLATNPSSLRLSINAMCYDCQGRNHDPGVIGRIRDCGITGCPLFNVRPYRVKQ